MAKVGEVGKKNHSPCACEEEQQPSIFTLAQGTSHRTHCFCRFLGQLQYAECQAFTRFSAPLPHPFPREHALTQLEFIRKTGAGWGRVRISEDNG